MKKTIMKNLKIDSGKVLSREQMKKISGGYKYCGDGAPCAPSEVCCKVACRRLNDPTSPCFTGV